MKLLGLSFGRKMENTEVLVKEALMGAEELGVEVGMIRLLDLDIKPCTGCEACVQNLLGGGSGNCVIKDDLPFVDEHLMECDGLIVGSPVYIKTPPGLFKTVCDRFGPSRDVAFMMQAKKIAAAKGKDKGKGPDERAFKKRAGVLICVGGAATPRWVSMGLPLMNLLTFPRQITIVDHMQALATNRYGNVVLNEEAMERARRLGRTVAEAMLNQEGEAQWMGDEPGTCPVCHSNLLIMGKKNSVECPLCGINGEIIVEGDEITVTFSEEEQKSSWLTMAGKIAHCMELGEDFKIKVQRMQEGGKEEIAKRLEKYKGYKELKIT